MTASGRIRLAEALIAEGFEKQAVEWLRHAWINDDFERKEQRRILKAHGERLRPHDHARRLDRLLWDRRRRDAGWMLKLVSAAVLSAAKDRASAGAQPRRCRHCFCPRSRDRRRHCTH